jgi:hypothetical protein
LCLNFVCIHLLIELGESIQVARPEEEMNLESYSLQDSAPWILFVSLIVDIRK